MDNKKETIPLSQTNDYSDVPSWYVLCTNGLCPFQGSCLRYQVASRAPESMETATCVMPKVLKDGKCRWYDRKTYYEYMRGERPLSPEQQQWIQDFVKSFGYEWEVPFDRYFEAYEYHHVLPSQT